MRGRLSVAAVLWLACGCTEEPRLLVVDLISDLRAGSEVVEARTTLLARDGGGLLREVSTPLGAELDLIEGTRVTELVVPPATYRLRVELLDRDGDVAVERLTFIDVTSDRVATIVLTRSCVGVDCSSDPAAIATCFGGGCVDPTCSPETPELCPPPECTTDADCPAATAACAEAVCVAGACGFTTLPDRCAPDARCDPDGGCVCDPGDGCICDPVEGLVVALSFEEGAGTTATSRPPGLDGTLVNGATWNATADGPCGGALELPGDRASVRFPTDGALDAALERDFTLAVWVRTTQPTSSTLVFPSIFSKEDARDPRLGPNLVLHGGDPIDPRWYFEIYDSTGPHQARGNMVSDDTWHHLVGVREGDRILAFEDGVFVSEVTTAGAESVRNGLALTLGIKANTAVDRYSYEGFLDEVRVFDRALTAEEVMALYLDQSTGCACQ